MAMDEPTTAALGRQAASELLQGLPDRPPVVLDQYLDATSRCLARFGVERTTVLDVANDLGLNRGTIYRQVGTMEQQVALLAARDLRRFLGTVPRRVAGLTGPALVVELAAISVEDAKAHPVLAKILADEPRLVGQILESHIGQLRDRVVPVIARLFAAGMAAGLITPMDPTVLASWVVRIVVSLVVLDPEIELRPYLREILVPALSPRPA
jgi:AcrR family transcriptional regulator